MGPGRCRPGSIHQLYCGTGWRVALTFFHAWLMGWEHISLYDGGWYEWRMGPDAAINPFIDEEPSLPEEGK